MRMQTVGAMTIALFLAAAWGWAGEVSGVVADRDGKGLRGVMVSAIDDSLSKSVSVFSSSEGRFAIDGLEDTSYTIRARIIGMDDRLVENVVPGTDGASNLAITLDETTDIDAQRLGDNLFSLIRFDSERDKQNFKMACTYCHQIGTVGFRSPEDPVDWETMITRMDGFGGLYKHTQETIVRRLLEAYSDEAIASWPPYTIPPAPDGAVLDARITEWDIGVKDNTNAHDLELGKDGQIYVVDMDNDALISLDPKTGERHRYRIPGGSYTGRANRRLGPHSIEADAEGNMWMTLAVGGKMAKFDVTTKEFTIVSSFPEPAVRGRYPHTLRIDQKGMVWYTDAGADVYSLDPETHEVTHYKLPSADQAIGGGRGESRGRTPYGIDIAPDGKVWYSKLNGNRVGRIDPSVPGGDVKEWAPPFRGPRRLHVAPNGIVWVPGFGSGVIGRFDPDTEEWAVYPLPDAENQIPYALNIHPKTGDVWICGTGNDQIIRFDPKSETFTHYPMPSRVTYTREIEFDDEGNVWTCNSNVPIRHAERGIGSIIKIEWQ